MITDTFWSADLILFKQQILEKHVIVTRTDSFRILLTSLAFFLFSKLQIHPVWISVLNVKGTIFEEN